NGNAFAHCVNERGDDCTEVVDSSASATTGNPATTGVGGGDTSAHGATTSTDAVSSSTGAGAGGSGGGTAALYAACCDTAGCHNDWFETGWCLMGFCSKSCASYTECDPTNGDCMDFGGNN